MAVAQQASEENQTDRVGNQDGALIMRAFFRGWKRKVGCVTLFIACILTTGWVRSRTEQDFVRIQRQSGKYFDGWRPVDTSFWIMSYGSALELASSTPTPPRKVASRQEPGADAGQTTFTMTTPSPPPKAPFLMWGSQKLEKYYQARGYSDGKLDDKWKFFDVEWRWDWGPFQFGAGHDGGNHDISFVFPVFPYWSIVVPLTGMSAWLFLSRRRGIPSTEPRA